ncbi:hypothetical protein ABH307_00550 [Acinetobacter pittii]|uniref:hypothetical protein n=1 Tax=Acinetobacter pittii TaxID=48296 RepID=UPI0032612771
MENVKIYFYTNIYEFILNYILSTPWLFYGLFIITAIFLLVFIPSVFDAYKKKPSDYKSILIAYSVLLSLILSSVFCYWSLTLDTDDDRTSGMQHKMVDVSYRNTEYNDYALKAYEYYIKDRKVKRWEAEAFKMGLDQLKFDDVRFQIKNRAKTELNIEGN